jgi:hypothetical protein
MSAQVWKVKAIKNHSKIIKGMEVEVIIKGRTGQPNVTEIRAALRNKYNIDASGVPLSTFEFYK